MPYMLRIKEVNISGVRTTDLFFITREDMENYVQENCLLDEEIERYERVRDTSGKFNRFKLIVTETPLEYTENH